MALYGEEDKLTHSQQLLDVQFISTVVQTPLKAAYVCFVPYVVLITL